MGGAVEGHLALDAHLQLAAVFFEFIPMNTARHAYYDKTTGKVLGEAALPRNATGAPMTYTLNGKQFIVVPTGGANLPAELIALSLP